MQDYNCIDASSNFIHFLVLFFPLVILVISYQLISSIKEWLVETFEYGLELLLKYREMITLAFRKGHFITSELTIGYNALEKLHHKIGVS